MPLLKAAPCPSSSTRTSRSHSWLQCSASAWDTLEIFVSQRRQKRQVRWIAPTYSIYKTSRNTWHSLDDPPSQEATSLALTAFFVSAQASGSTLGYIAVNNIWFLRETWIIYLVMYFTFLPQFNFIIYIGFRNDQSMQNGHPMINLLFKYEYLV